MEREKIIKLDPSTNHPDNRALRQAVHGSRYVVGNVGDICEEIQDGLHGVRHYVDEGIPLLGVGNVTEEGLNLSEVNQITPEEHTRLKRSQVSNGDVLVTITGRLGTAMIYGSDNEANLSAHVARVRVKPEHNAGYLAAYLNSTIGKHFIGLNQIGSTHPHINVNRLKDVTLVIPPRPIQDTIADKMDAAYRRKRELEAEAETLRESIDGYVLGELGIELPELTDEKHFAGWANETRGGRLDTQYYQPKFVTVFNLLASLKNIKTVGDVAHLIRNGADIRDYLAEGTPYLRVGDIKSGSIVLDKVKFVAAVPDNVPESQRVRAGDALFTRKGSYGNVAAVKQEHESCIISSELIRIVLDQSIDADYFAIVMNSPVGKLQSERNAVGAVMPGISHPVLRTYKIPLTSSTHQHAIVAEVQHRREQAAALQEEAKRVLAEAGAEVERMILGEDMEIAATRGANSALR